MKKSLPDFAECDWCANIKCPSAVFFFIFFKIYEKNRARKCQSPPSVLWNVSWVLYSLWMSWFFHMITDPKPSLLSSCGLAHKFRACCRFRDWNVFLCLSSQEDSSLLFLEWWTFWNVTSSSACASKVHSQRARSHVHISIIGQSQGLLGWRCTFALLG